MTYKEFYTMPLVLHYGKVHTANYGMAFDFIPTFMKDIDSFQVSQDDKEKLVNVINGSGEKLKTRLDLSYKNGTISVGEQPFIWIRGWGGLTGTGGGLGLSDDEAIKIQDDFAAFIIAMMEEAFEN